MSTVYETAATAITEDGDTDINLVTGEDYSISVAGTFDSASLTFFFVDGAGNEVPVPTAGSTDGAGSPLTVTDSALFEIAAHSSVLRITTADAGGSCSLNVQATKIRK